MKLEKTKLSFKRLQVELRCEKIIQIKGCEKFENDRRSRSDQDHFFCTK